MLHRLQRLHRYNFKKRLIRSPFKTKDSHERIRH